MAIKKFVGNPAIQRGKRGISEGRGPYLNVAMTPNLSGSLCTFVRKGG